MLAKKAEYKALTGQDPPSAGKGSSKKDKKAKKAKSAAVAAQVGADAGDSAAASPEAAALLAQIAEAGAALREAKADKSRSKEQNQPLASDLSAGRHSRFVPTDR